MFMRDRSSEPMNPGPLFTVRKQFYFTLLTFTFLALKYYENKKTFIAFAFTVLTYFPFCFHLV
jgi:hypothetical protein